MRVAVLVEAARREKLPPLQRKVLDYLDAHPDEVFEYRDRELVQNVGGKPSSIGFSLWALEKRHLIGKQVVAGKVFFGSKQAMASLRQNLDLSVEDYWERVDRLRESIRQKHGNIDVLGLLDEVREGR